MNVALLYFLHNSRAKFIRSVFSLAISFVSDPGLGSEKTAWQLENHQPALKEKLILRTAVIKEK